MEEIYYTGFMKINGVQIYLDKDLETELEALREAEKAIKREIIRHESGTSKRFHR